jgi:hypothetical protein
VRSPQLSPVEGSKTHLSPGIVVTPAQLDALIDSFPIVPKTSLADSVTQAQLLGEFNDPNFVWPINYRKGESVVDMVLGENLLSPGQVRPAAQLLLDAVGGHGLKTNHLLLGVSGGGKTSAVADVARSHFVVYVRCTSREMSLRHAQGYDAGFVDTVENYEVGRVHDYVKDELEAKRVSSIDVVCRLAQLRKLVLEFNKTGRLLTPWEFFVHQQRADNEWTHQLRQQLKNVEVETCRFLATHLINTFQDTILSRAGAPEPRVKLLVSMDEIEAGAKECIGHFHAIKESNGFLTPYVGALTSLLDPHGIHVLYSGTGTSLHRISTLASGIGKVDSLNVVQASSSEDLEVFPTVTGQACRLLFTRLNAADVLDLGGISDDREGALFDKKSKLNTFDPDQASGSDSLELVNRFVVGGRFRLLTLVVHFLSTNQGHDSMKPTLSKAARLRSAILLSIRYVRDHLKKSFDITVGDGVRESPDEQVKGIRYLRTVFTAAVLSNGRARLLDSKAGLDLTRLAIGNFIGGSTDEDGAYAVTEAVVIDAIYEFLEANEGLVKDGEFATIVSALSDLVERHGLSPARGFLFEDVVFNALVDPGRGFQGKTLAQLPFVVHGKRGAPVTRATRSTPLPPVAVPTWTTQTTFRATSVQRRTFLDEETTTPAFLASEAAVGVVFSPETVARMDAVVMQRAPVVEDGDVKSEGLALVLGITMWSERVPRGKIRSQLKSTASDNAYKDKTGMEVNENCVEQREEWERRGLHKTKAVRVHVSLPGFKEDATGLDNFGDDLVVHLDASNIHHLLGPDHRGLYKLLAVATATKADAETWPGMAL